MELLIAHFAATWFMVGLIWVIQVVHYPLFASVGAAGFVRYEQQHTWRMGWLLALPALVEIASAALLVWFRPAGVSLGIVLVSGGLLAAVWVMTAAVQAPIHGRLSSGYDEALVRRLVTSNWWRTAGWTGRGVLAAGMLLQA